MLAEPSAVTGRWCVIYLHTALIATCLDSSPLLFLILVLAWIITTTGGEEPSVKGWLFTDERQPPVGLHFMVSVNSVMIIKS